MTMRSTNVILAATMIVAPLFGAEVMPPAQQAALVQHYCAVCHTDAARNGGLSLEHYDAAKRDPQLAAMLLSKLRNGAMGAAGLGVPDKVTQEAWVAATTAQAEEAKSWSVTRNDAVMTASIVRYVAPRKKGEDTPIYRLTMSCDTASHQGETELTWSPAPQKDRTFMVTADDGAEVPNRIQGE